MYSQSYIIKGIFEEVEISQFTRADIEALGNLIDDKMAARILSFLERVKTTSLATDQNSWAQVLRERAAAFEEILETKLKRYTFHLELQERKYSEKLQLLDITSAMDVFSSLDEGIEMLSWILGNRQYWMPTISPRQKENISIFLDCIADLDIRASVLADSMANIGVEVDHCANLKDRVKHNMPMFYDANEKSRATGVKRIIDRSLDLEIVLHGLIFRKRIKAEKTTLIDWRKI